jgi:hypothetical protein
VDPSLLSFPPPVHAVDTSATTATNATSILDFRIPFSLPGHFATILSDS